MRKIVLHTTSVVQVGFVSTCFSRRWKGDYGFNVFHNSNPQHGGSYARHERRMRDDEVEDFLNSVKGWKSFLEPLSEADTERLDGGRKHTAESEKDQPPPMSTAHIGEEAITRTFVFVDFDDAYLFMGRLWAFCYGADKYPHVTWDNTAVTVTLYSPSFKGLSKREARVAAFLNDQYNMFKKSRKQRESVVQGVTRRSAIEEILGAQVQEELERRRQQQTAPLPEVKDGPTSWEHLIAKSSGHSTS